MLWKLYFFIAICEAILAVTGLFFNPGYHVFTQTVMAGIFLIALYGLYEYVFHKELLTKLFWQYFLGIYILTDVLYLIYATAPHAPIISSLAFLTIYKDDTYLLLNAIIGVLIDIPLLYALYRLTKEEVYPQKKLTAKIIRNKWGMLQTALWGYSFIIVLFLFILSFFQSDSGNKNISLDENSMLFITILFIPLLMFWLWVVLFYKRYRWNWWRTTLVANALLYTGFLIFGALFPSTEKGASGFDVISILQLFILLLSLYFFGREQFK
jgi:hypothetical protein